jgi:two-component system cell cycle sensor histidine kinase/response regulator CckA
MRRIAVLFLIWIVTPCLLCSLSNDVLAESEPARVLLISSYHPGFPTFFEQVRGINSVFSGNGVFLDVEFMDKKRFAEAENEKLFLEMLSYKLGRTKPYDAIMTADDDALLFLLKQTSNLFSAQPAVFFGVNNIARAKGLSGSKGITGVIEAVSMKETVELMLDLLPGTRKVLALVDTTPSSVGDLHTFRSLSSSFPQFTFSTLSLGDHSFAEFADALQKVGSDTAVLLLSAYVDKEQNRMVFEDSLRLILENLQQPLFHLWYHGMGDGMIGGRVISHEQQGKTAAELVLRILAGEPAESIKVIEQSPNVTLVDYDVMKKFGLENTKLANDAIVLNKPFSLYYRYKYRLWLGALFLISQTLLILFLIRVVRRNKATEFDLRERDRLLTRFIGNSPIYAYIQEVSPNLCRSVSASENFKELTGIPARQMIGKSMEELFPEDFAAKVTSDSWAVFSSGKVSTMEEEHDGRSFITIKFPLKVKGRNLVGGYSIDITMRKKAEQDLRHSYDLMRYIIKHDTSALAVHDRDLNYLFVSDRYLKDYKVKDKNIIGRHHYDVFPDLPQKWRDVHQKALAGITSRAQRDRYDREDGSVEWTTWECRPWYQANGEVGGFVLYTEVITDKVIAEEQKLALQQQLHQAQKMEAIGTLAGGIAHDFNNILGAIIGYAEMAYEDSLSGSVNPSDINQVIVAGHRAKDLVKQILVFSRQTENQKIPLRPATLIKESVKMLRSTIPTTIDIRLDMDAGTGHILADPTEIHQVILNLCTNAYHVMEETGGILSISLKNTSLSRPDLIDITGVKPGEFVLLTVKDTGAGIPRENREKIFNPFFTTKEVGKGTGMGLAIVHGIVKNSGGFITFQSEPGKGTVFEVFLPVLSGQTATEDNERQLIPTGTERILFVDDEKILAEMGQTMLERLGYTVTVQSGSVQALANFQANPGAFDLVITDQTMPEMTGLEMARYMLDIRPDLPVILCTGYSNQISEEKIEFYKIRGFAMKPLVRKDIAVLIRRILDGIEG